MKGLIRYGKIVIIRLVVLTLCWITSIPSISAQVKPTYKSSGAFVRRIDALMPQLLSEFRVPGAAVALITNGKYVFLRGYGYANVTGKKPVTARTVFNVASVSKTITAWGVMRLVEQGKLELDAPVEQYLKRWHLPTSEFDARGVTVRRLLSHTAGLSRPSVPEFNSKDRLPSLEESLSNTINGRIEPVKLIVAPGTKWQYSGGGYGLLQLLIEERSGQNFSEYMREQILQPLGMTRSDFKMTTEIQLATAIPYDEWVRQTEDFRFTETAAAGLHTTIEDLARFAVSSMQSQSRSTSGRSLLKPETLALMQTPSIATDGIYGLGYGITTLPNGEQVVGHHGSNDGWRGFFQVFSQKGDGLIILTNGSNGESVYQAIKCEWYKWHSNVTSEETCKKSVGVALIGTVLDQGVAAVRRRYFELKSAQPNAYSFDKQELNTLGYRLIEIGRFKDAIEVFKLNVEVYPEWYNAYDSLAEAYMDNGDKELAIKNYETSLKLNPENTNAVKKLEQLRK